MATGFKGDDELDVEFVVNFFNEDVYAIEEKQEPAKNEAPKKSSQNFAAPPAKKEAVKEGQPKAELLRHKVCVLTHYPGKKENILAKDKLFLENILKAVNISLTKTDIINLASHQLFSYHLLANATTENVLAFGLPQEMKPKSAQTYSIHELPGAKAIFAAPLSEIAADRDKKMQLWGALQQMFNI